MNRFSRLCEAPWFCLILLVLISSLVVVLPIAIGGLHASGDLVVYLSFAEGLQTSMASGDLIPGWANDNRGFGSIGIRFYPPVVPYILALIAGLTDSWYDGLWLCFFGWMFIGCSGIYFFVKDWGTPVQALSAGMLYAVIPFPLAEIYQFSLFAEFAAGSVIPFCFLFVTRICRKREWFDVIWLAVSFSVLVLTHIPATIITTISLFIYILFLIDLKNLGKTILQLGTAAAMSLLASAFYWINLVAEITWLAHYKDEYSTGFAGFQEWLFPNWIIARDVPYYYFPIFRNIDAMIVLTVFSLMPFLVAWWAGSREQAKNAGWRLESAVTVTALFAFFMTTWASFFIWSEVALLQKIQFPWRWLTVLSVLATISFVLSIPRLCLRFPVYRTVIAFCAAGLISLMLAFDVRLSFARPNRISRSDFQNMLGDSSRSHGSFRAWWPVWANANALETTDQVVADGRSVEISSWESKERRFAVSDGRPTLVRVATFYYPHWQATINGQSAAVDKDENGAILIPVGTGTSDVHLFFEEPRLNKAASWLSLMSWIVLGLVMLLRVLRRSRHGGGRSSHRNMSGADNGRKSMT